MIFSQISLINKQVISVLLAHCYCCSLQFCFDYWRWCWNHIKSTEAVKCVCVCYMLYDTIWWIYFICALAKKRQETLMDLNCSSSYRKHYSIVIIIIAVAACIESMRTLVCHLSVLPSCAMCIQHVSNTYTLWAAAIMCFLHFVYIALFLKWKWKFNWMFYNACTHTPNISKERRVSNILLTAQTHTLTQH